MALGLPRVTLWSRALGLVASLWLFRAVGDSRRASVCFVCFCVFVRPFSRLPTRQTVLVVFPYPFQTCLNHGRPPSEEAKSGGEDEGGGGDKQQRIRVGVSPWTRCEPSSHAERERRRPRTACVVAPRLGNQTPAMAGMVSAARQLQTSLQPFQVVGGRRHSASAGHGWTLRPISPPSADTTLPLFLALGSPIVLLPSVPHARHRLG